MELVILDHDPKGVSLIRKHDNGRYSAISDPVFHGVIVEAENFENLEQAAHKFNFTKKFNLSKLILQVKPNCCVWYVATGDLNISKLIDEKYDEKHQMILFETDKPIQVASDFNLEENDPNEIKIHTFFNDSNKNCRFNCEYSFDMYKYFTKGMNCSYQIMKEDGTLSKSFSRVGSINKIEQMKKKFVTVIIEDVVKSNSPSDDFIKHYAYKAAFDAKLVGNVYTDKMRLLTAIRDVNQNIKRHNLYSPTVSINQGSGSGKTKLACSLDSDLACAYVVFRNNGKLSYPEKSKIGDLFMHCIMPLIECSFKGLDLNDTNIGRYVHLIYAIASDYLARVKTLKSELNASGNAITESQSKQIRQLIMQEFVEGTFTGDQLENFGHGMYLRELFKDKNEWAFRRFSYKIEACCESISEELNLPPETSPLVIILDEIHLLSGIQKGIRESRLKILRRAMHALGTISGIVFLTLSTDADHTDWNPIYGIDTMDKRFELYPPFIISSNTDIFRSQVSKLQMSAAVLKDPRMILIRYAMGRPLWSSLAISEVKRMAGIKLENSSTESALVACWMLRTGIPTSPHKIDTSRQLVKSHLATLLSIHPTLPLMNVCYPSEPVLAMAAQDLVKHNLFKYFEMLRNHLVCKGFDRDDLAETLAAEICIQAAYNAKRVEINTTGSCKELDKIEFAHSEKFILQSQVNPDTLKRKVEKYYIGSCSVSSVASNEMKLTTLENFLKALYGKWYDSLKLEESISRRMLDGIVDFNHFIRLNKGFTLTVFFEVDELKNTAKHSLPKIPDAKHDAIKVNCRGICNLGLKRGAAFFTPEGHPGADLMIPICLEDDEPEETIAASEFVQDATPKKKPTLTMLSIKVNSGSLSRAGKEECANNLFMDTNYIKCSANNNCDGCDYCETEENIEFLMSNQLALVFTFGPKNEKSKSKKVEKIVLDRDSSNLTVIFNNGPEYLRGLCDPDNHYKDIIKIMHEILDFSWLPHNFIDKTNGIGRYHRNQLLEAYLDKPLFPEFSDLFREELGWPDIENPLEEKRKYEKLINGITIKKK